MSVFIGDNLKIELFGESHSEYISAVVFGLPKFDFDRKELSLFMKRRKGGGVCYSTPRVEPDKLIFNELPDGGLEIKIANTNVKKNDYANLYGKPRPSHADYCSFLKNGTLDFCGGGRFSGRLTALLCAVGGICLQYISKFGVQIGAYISQVGDIKALSYKHKKLTYNELTSLRDNGFPSLDKKQEILNLLESVREGGDSVGARCDVVVFNMLKGLGDSYFEGLEGKIASLIYSIPAVKGVEFGIGFDFASSFGGAVNDQLTYKNGAIISLSNNSGGIYGGISSGEDITLSVAFKPTPSISKEQQTVDLVNKVSCKISVLGRHDACIAPRALPCLEAVVAIALVDEMLKN